MNRVWKNADQERVADSPMAMHMSGRQVLEDASSEVTLNRAAQWVGNCIKTHSHCQTADASLPTRVLDLDALSDPGKIKLVETDGARGQYIALSHCWGVDKGAHFITSRDNIAKRMSGIDLNEVPQTFKDAVLVTRHLGIRYLWIDSLCICQGDSEDWARESAAMTELYSNAYLSLAADCARENNDGFLRRTARRYVPISVDAIGGDGHGSQLLAFPVPSDKATLDRAILEMHGEPLVSRAWALQERLLPHRTLHYGTDQMYFECNEEFISEDGFRSLGRYNGLHPGPVPSYVPIARESRHSTHHQLWYKILEDYTMRNLTQPSDKLAAISGLARLFEKRIGAPYLAGVWGDAIVEGLGWQGMGFARDVGTTTPDQPQAYIAPSWSWASYGGVSAHGTTGPGWKDVAIVLDSSAEPSTINPYGAVRTAWIKLSAPLFRLRISETPERDGKERALRLRTEHGDPDGAYVMFDRFEQQGSYSVRPWAEGRELFALVLAMEADPCYQALVVEVDATESLVGVQCFRRLGFMITSGSFSKEEEDIIGDPSAFQTVTLV
jgi:hypothetical protein